MFSFSVLRQWWRQGIRWALWLVWVLPGGAGLVGCEGAGPSSGRAKVVSPGAEAIQLNTMAEKQLGEDPARALATAQRAESRALAAADRIARAQALQTQGLAYYQLEQHGRAREVLVEALAIYTQAGDARGQAKCYNHLGNVYLEIYQFRRSLESHRQSLRLARQLGDSVEVGRSYLNQATTYSIVDTTQTQALALYRLALARFEAAGNEGLEAVARNNIGDVLLARSAFAEARPYFERSVVISRHLGRLDWQAKFLQNLGRVHAGLREWAVAERYYRQSLAVGRSFPETLRDNYRYLALTHAEAGDHRAAYAEFLRFAALKDSAFDRETTDRINELETRFNTRDKERQIEGQRATIAGKNRLIYVAAAATLLLLLLAGNLGYQMRQRNRANRQLAQANAEIRAAVAQKETLIQEVHHRVKNNLQMVSSLLTLQATANPAARPAVEESQARIQAMALVHEHLYRSEDLAQVRLDEYLGQLLTSLHAAHTSSARALELVTELAPLVMEAKDAIPLGLLVNELVTNVYKHAFRDRSAGRLRVQLSVEENTPTAPGFCLRIFDDGVGIPSGSPPAAADSAGLSSLGLQLVRLFSRQLKAVIRTEPVPTGGTCVEIRRGQPTVAAVVPMPTR